MTNSSLDRGLLLVLSAPVGLGKATLCEALLDRDPNARLSISSTTRPRQAREAEGFDYYFLSEKEFQERISAGRFLEHVNIHGHFFGTPREETEKELSAGHDMILNVDARGAQLIKTAYPDAITVFLCPPSVEEFMQKLNSYAQGVEQKVSDLWVTARAEMAQAKTYDYILTMDQLINTAESLAAILRAERSRAVRRFPSVNRLISSHS